jgi:antibiotic biosynthesis monooxygenase (ABM) superfamily enzyme
MGLEKDGPVTAVVTRTPKRDKVAEFEEWLQGFIGESLRFEGHLGVNVIRPADEAKRQYVIIVRFNNLENMLKWENSDERNRWIEKGRRFTEDEGKIEKLTGMEFWFTPFTFRNPKGQGQVPLTPPRYKMAIVTTAVIFMLLTTIIPLVHKLNEEIPSLLRMLMETSIIVVLMTYVIMPNVTQVLSPWLSKRSLF